MISTTNGPLGQVELPGAVGDAVVSLVTGPMRPATVLAVRNAAVMICVDADSGEQPTRIVSLTTTDASGVPNGVRTTLHSTDRPFAAIAASDAAFVGGGRIQLTNLTVRGVRKINTRTPVITPIYDAARIIDRETTGRERGVPGVDVDALTKALASGRADMLRTAVAGLVGLGTGSTPGGDDVLCGVLAALHATSRDVLAQQVGVAACTDLVNRTTVMSAELLRLAAAGHVCREAGEVLRGAGHSAAALTAALPALLALGHSSGADLATGLAIGLATPHQPPPRQPRRHSVSAGS